MAQQAKAEPLSGMEGNSFPPGSLTVAAPHHGGGRGPNARSQVLPGRGAKSVSSQDGGAPQQRPGPVKSGRMPSLEEWPRKNFEKLYYAVNMLAVINPQKGLITD